jgi:photosynthetic reaction center cytochrome c subunit
MKLQFNSFLAVKNVTNLIVVVCISFLLLACEVPPMDPKQQGYRGVGMENVVNPRIKTNVLANNVSPEPAAKVSSAGPRAGDTFQNVKVLGDLSVGEFTRLMTTMTQWVAPEKGCNHCHVAGDLASDDIYTKDVARSMIQMTRNANSEWTAHVGDTGVTCYTCHRGKPVPSVTWSEMDAPAHAKGIKRADQNIASATVAYSSLPYDPLSDYLNNKNEISVAGKAALPKDPGATILQTERTYGLMMHMSDSLGVNCTHCHNSRSFYDWEQSPAARVNAWHAIRHVRKMNNEYIDGVADILPDSRKGPKGDTLKVNCNTCHRGLNKPLQGVSMLDSYPSLAK